MSSGLHDPPRRATPQAARSLRALVLCAAVIGAGGCSKLNPAFLDGDTEAVSDSAEPGTGRPTSTTGSDSSKETSGGQSDSQSGPPPLPTTSPTGSPTASQTGRGSSSGDLESDSTGYGSETTALGSETGRELDCELGDEPCDVYTSDCPEGSACRPQGVDDESYDVTACVEVVDASDVPEISATCEIECHRFSGIDNCAVGDLCDPFQLDEQTRRCVALCDANPAVTSCIGESSCVPSVVSGPDFGLCRPHCNPFNTTSCPPALVCAALGAELGPQFVCVPLVEEPGDEGDPCAHPGDCSEGLQCATCPSGNCCAPVCSPLEGSLDCENNLTCEPYAVVGGHGDIPESIGVCVE